MAAIAHAATLESRVPFLHFFDGFRTSSRGAQDRAADGRRPALPDARPDGGRAPRARAQPRPAGAARHRAEPRRLLPGPRGLQPLLRRPAGDRREEDGPLRRAHRPALPAVRVRRPPAGRARDRADGLGRRGRARDRGAPGRPRREGRHAEGAPLPAVLGEALRAGAAEERARDRGARPHQGAGRGRRAALPRRGHRARTRRARRAEHALRRPAGDRRPLRAELEGVHPGHGEGGVRRARAPRRPAQPLHRRHRRRRQPHLAPRGPRVRHRVRRPRARASSSASAPTAPWAPTRTRSRSSARRPTTTPRATSSTTPRSRAPSPSRTCASAPGRSAPRT